MMPSTSTWAEGECTNGGTSTRASKDDYTVVVFFHASNPNPGIAGKSGVELVVVRPNGERTQRFIQYDRSRFSASREEPDVRVGDNYSEGRLFEG